MRISRFTLLLVPTTIAATFFADLMVSHGIALWLFTFLNILLIYTIRIKQKSWFYGFLASFFFLGCWLKVIVHHIFSYPYVEPSGNFTGLDIQWGEYYFTSSIFAGALIVARLFWIFFEKPENIIFSWRATVRPVRINEWFRLVGFCSSFYLVNNLFAFFVTGVDAKLKLPLGLNAPIGFMALIGIPVVLSMYLARDVAIRQKLHLRSVFSMLAIVAIASVSMASRAAIVMQAIPMLIAATYSVSKISLQPINLRPFFIFGGFLLGVISLVSIYRIQIFAGGSAEDAELLTNFALESVFLVVDRWIGAEAIMVAVSEPTQSLGLFIQMLLEDPTKGVYSIYQNLAGSKYEFLRGLTFLTLPGYFGVIGLSGSKYLVFIVTMLLTLSGIAYERFTQWAMFGQSISVALISAAMANAITQMGFPRLIFPFVFQMTALMLLLHYFFRRKFSHSRAKIAVINYLFPVNKSNYER